ncbi:MAG TPA: acetyl-CoA carboxylase biotin carboxyl carrier protein [Caulobacteraceae bacterium]|nr:acetyl-CoA carboxylase biotin carboxyl carrier protein [Caulobacteraceae bacterium]
MFTNPTNHTDPAEAFDARLVRELAGILNETGLTEIEVERGDVKVRVAKAPAASGLTAFAAAPPQAAAAPTVGQGGPPAGEAEPAGEVVKSPMVGTVYLQAQPGAAPFAKVGDRVQAGDTLLLVEAMKTMNPITAPRAGRIMEFIVADGQPVEFGEPLIVLE